MKEIELENRQIGPGHPPFIIAEMSGNHNHSLERALDIVEVAAKAGADALKIQTYTAETMTLNNSREEFIIGDSKSPWKNKTLFDLYQEAYTPWEWHQPIFDRCRKLGMIGFSTPFDETAVNFLESLNTPCYKIASFECTDLPLIRKVAQTKKPMIISTGMCSAAEIEETVNTAREAGCQDLILLKCTSTYPASPENTNILTIPHMKDLFQCQVGLSDHTMGSGVAVASVALGATTIEKHLTLSRSDGGVDAGFSLEPEEMQTMITETKRAWQALGSIHYGATKEEESSKKYRRSLYVMKDMKKGDAFTKDNLKAIRPGYGLPPKYYDVLLGREVNQDVEQGTAITWDII
ncbi:pseudaminic acid synthase [Virgibacillus sp. C22-A2]|uniref:Pseudaminic acid synthase n=1 Tax=Virgibacillus tibetensis TaxID=3042313 RepID=A0ABU6KGK9_9BACI|nr:pseudaminic acid synthase [Virgibacillus sp. C22-A2]